MSVSICGKIGSAPRKAGSLLLGSYAYTLQGDLDTALSMTNKAMTIFSEINHERGISNSYAFLGIIHRYQGKLELARINLEKSFDLFKQMSRGGSNNFQGFYLWSSFLLVHLVLVAQSLDDFSLAEKYLKQLEDSQVKSRSRFVNVRARFAKAIVLIMSKRAVQKFQAQQIFAEIIDEEVLDINLTVVAILNLCELLILEIKLVEDPEELLREITVLSQRFTEIAEKQQSAPLEVTALILKAKLSLIEGGFEETDTLLSKAKTIAAERKLGSLLSKVTAEHKAVQAEINRWHDLIFRETSLHERIIKARVTDWLNEAKKIQGAWVPPSADL